MNRPSIQHFDHSPLRKEGDSNPRYGYPHGSLANCWFQPLTQTSLAVCTAAFSLKCGAKVSYIFVTCKFFGMFFLKFFRLLSFVAVFQCITVVGKWATGAHRIAFLGLFPHFLDSTGGICQCCCHYNRGYYVLYYHFVFGSWGTLSGCIFYSHCYPGVPAALVPSVMER